MEPDGTSDYSKTVLQYDVSRVSFKKTGSKWSKTIEKVIRFYYIDKTKLRLFEVTCLENHFCKMEYYCRGDEIDHIAFPYNLRFLISFNKVFKKGKNFAFLPK
jgi:hypothetical protein